VHGADGLGGIALPDGDPPEAELAADAIRRILRPRRAGDLVGVAPVTNLALALMTEPSSFPHLPDRSDVRRLGRRQRDARGRVQRAERSRGAGGAARVRPAVVFATLELTAQALVTPEPLAALRGLGPGAA